MVLSSKEGSHLESHASTATSTAWQQKRASSWLQTLLPPDIPNYTSIETSEEVGVRNRKGKRMSHLLEKWTDQGQMLDEWYASAIEQHQKAVDSPSSCQKNKAIGPLNDSLELLPATKYVDREYADYSHCEHSTSYKRSHQPRPLLLSKELPTPPDTPHTIRLAHASPRHLVPQDYSTPTTAGMVTPQSHLTRSNSVLPPPLTPSTMQTLEKKPSLSVSTIECFKNFRLGKDDTCEKMLPVAVRKHKLAGDWQHYALFISVDNQERRLGLQEKPLAIYSRLGREGKKVSFKLRKLEMLSAGYDNSPDFI